MTNERLTQLDIFEHSRDVSLRNDVMQAFESQDAAAAIAACDRLAREFPLNATLGAVRVLVKALENLGAPILPDHAELAEARRQVDEAIFPAAGQALGDGAVHWIAGVWADLAQR